MTDKLAVELVRCGFTGGLGFFDGFKKPKMQGLLVNRDMRKPSTSFL